VVGQRVEARAKLGTIDGTGTGWYASLVGIALDLLLVRGFYYAASSNSFVLPATSASILALTCTFCRFIFHHRTGVLLLKRSLSYFVLLLIYSLSPLRCERSIRMVHTTSSMMMTGHRGESARERAFA
jgi:hypothetical protein